ncbi:unnamed protein product [Rotaria sordida]|uniref:Chromo domain-containing protein n=1 Tax=Rotaria sordida TaxID=392033 RepID=A0A814E0C4_9BILA|nr:unnamed protein product [Rotaria sordida]CAF0882112.1 unnamed protein product [Rotaria sordida]CAF0891402.1 unnamed protein product [Rotaria sordida]CAF0959589.1 unnamed protein product [Rotaria sordida]CAF1004176.1 unnamed protein product [Rotaria sordida]
MVKTSSKKRPHESSSSSDESESENEFQVEAIVDKRTKGKKIQYLLKWKGYTDDDNTWEDKNNLNCPELVKEFEENLKKKTNERKSIRKSEPKSKTKSNKKAKLDESFEDDEIDENSSINKDKDIYSNENDDDHSQVDVTYHSPASILSNGNDTSNKSPIRSISKSESMNGDVNEENKNSNNETITSEDNNNSIELLNKSSPIKENLLNEQSNEPPVNLRLRITPSSASSISLTLNDSDNNNNTNDKSIIINNEQEQEQQDIINNDDEETIEKIEGVKNDQDGISFRIKLIGQNDTQWISAKIANRKYPQAVIAFWESHVEFT